eukprot:UN00947
MKIGLNESAIVIWRRKMSYDKSTWQSKLYELGKGKYVAKLEAADYESLEDIVESTEKELAEALDAKHVVASRLIRKLKSVL